MPSRHPAPVDPPAGSPDLSPMTPEGFAARPLSTMAVGGLIYRAVAAPVPLLGFLGEVGWGPASARISLVMGVLIVAHAVVLRHVLRPSGSSFLDRRSTLVLDCCLAAALAVWGAATVAEGTLDAAYHDVFWFYVMGAVALWAGLRGATTGVVLVVAAVPLQAAMVVANSLPLAELNPFRAAARLGWLLLAVLLVVIVRSLLRESARTAAVAGHRAGRQAEQIELLRSMHDTVLQTLEAVVLQARRRPATEDLMREIETGARQQARQLRALLRRRADAVDGDEPDGDLGQTAELRDALGDLVGEAGLRGLRVHLVTAEALWEPPSAVREGLVEATREALMNVTKHAGVEVAVVRAVSSDGHVEVTVRDHGVGFTADSVPMGFGLRESVTERVRSVGGDCEVTSARGHGTRVRLWFPR